MTYVASQMNLDVYRYWDAAELYFDQKLNQSGANQ